MTFDPDKFLADYDAQPAAEGVPPMLARPNAGNVPNYTADVPPAPAHDEVKPGQAGAVRTAIAAAMAKPGFAEMPPAAKQNAVIEAVHAVTRAAGAAIPLGHVAGAALETMPVIGNGRPFADNLNALDQGAADSAAAHPVASMLGTTAGLGATVAASGGFLSPGATAPVAGPSLARLVAPVAENAAIGGTQGAAETAARGGDANDVLREAGNGALAGATVGAAIPAAGAAGGKALLGAVNRSDARMLSEVGDGAPKVTRFKLNEKGNDVVDLIRRTPALEKTWKNPAEFTSAAKTELGKNGRELDSIYEASDKGGKIDPGTAVAALTRVQQTIGKNLSGEEVASALQPTIDKLDRRATKMQPIGAAELRSEITRLQDIAFHKGPGAETTTVQNAAAASANALKDVLEKHVEANLPGQLDRVRALNSDQTVLARIKGAAEYKALNKPNDNTSRLTKAVHGAVNYGAGAIGAGTLAHGVMSGSPAEIAAGAVEAVAPHVIPPAVRGVDETLAKVGRSAGITRTESLAPLTQRLTMAKDPGQVKNELLAHVFGDKPASSGAPDADLQDAANKIFGGGE